ncbi:MAG: hypothetical protein AB8H79_15890 [Myxococcota bacterium]
MVVPSRVLASLLIVLSACAGPELLAPTVDLGPDPAVTTADLVAVVTDADPAPEAELSIVWRVDGQEMGDLSGQSTVPSGRTSKNSEWSVTAFYVDSRGNEGPSASASVRVVNSAPVVTGSVEPAEPLTDEDLTAIASVTDVDADPTTFTVEWLRDGGATGLGGVTLPAAETGRGQVWTAVITPNDGEVDGEPVSIDVNIANKPPVATLARITPGEATETTVLTGTAEGSDPDGDPVGWSYQWTINGEAVPGATTNELTGATFDKGDQVRLVATPNDGFIDGAPVTSDFVLVQNTPPTVATASFSPSEVFATTTLTCVGAGFQDIDGDSEALFYAWQVNGSIVATSAQLSAGSVKRGDSVGCSVTPFDGEVEGVAAVSPTVVVQNSAPTLASVAVSPSAPKVADSLTSTLGSATDPDGDTVSYSYAWSVDGKPVGSSSTLSSGNFKSGDAITVTVTPTDGIDAGAAVVSPVVTAVNTAPVLTRVTLSPTNPDTDTSVSASVAATDADGDALTYTYAWTVSGSTVSGSGGQLASSAFKKGDTISVTATANDGTDNSAAVSSSTVTVVNSAPTLTGATLSPTTPREGSIMTCAGTGFDDADGDSATYRYAWAVNGSAVSGATGSTLSGASFDKGDKVLCRVTPFDGTDTGPVRTSPVRTVLNTAPALTSVSLSPSSPKTGDRVTATASGVTDADADAVTLSMAFYAGGSLVGTESTTSTSTTLLPSSGWSKGDKIEVRVTPTDGTNAGTTVVSPSVIVANSAPVITSATVLGPLRTTSTARASRSFSDPDGDTLTESYAWTVNGSSVGGTGSTLAGTSFKKGEKVAYTLTVSDGSLSDSQAAPGLTVLNSAPTKPGIKLNSTKVVDSADIYCDVSSASTDADGDSIEYVFEWEVDGKAWGGSTTKTTHAGDTIDADDTLPGEKWTCSAYATDGSDDSGTVTTSAAQVSNEFPLKVGSRSSYEVASGDHWIVCSSKTNEAVLSADVSGTYDPDAICLAYGYDGFTKFGTFATSARSCSTSTFNSKGGGTRNTLVGRVQWLCETTFKSTGGGGGTSIP